MATSSKLLHLLILVVPGLAATYTVNAAGGGNYTTIQACANAAAAGDVCSIAPGTYDERVSPPTSGTVGNVITFKGATDCVSNNGATIAASCAKVRGFTMTSKNYITIRGLELTNQGMSSDTTQSLLITGTNVSILNNYIHDTTQSCIRYNNGSNSLRISGNNITLCGASSQIVNSVAGPYAITAGVNDKVKLTVQGVDTTVTLTSGASRTAQQVMTELTSGISGISGVLGATGKFNLWSTTLGPSSSLAVASVANNAYATLGLSVGAGQVNGSSIGVTSGGTGGSSGFLIENNVISYVSDYFIPSGTTDTQGVYRNNTLGPNSSWTYFHIDGWQPGPSNYILAEGNLFVDHQNSDNHFLLNQTSSDHFILRMNRTCRSAAGVEFQGSGLYFYNNTWYENYASAVVGGGSGGASLNVNAASATAFARNNVWYKSINPDGAHGLVYQTASGGAIDHDYSLWFGFPNPGDTHYVNAEPLLVNGANCDFRLQSTSPARNAGGPLTTVAGSDTGSGMTLVLTDAGYFQPGWAGTNADWIRIGSTTTAQISSIDYATNTVTLVSGVSRNVGDPVYLYKNSSGTVVLLDGQNPDLGAFPYIPAGSGSGGPVTRGGSVSFN